uniref:Sialidase domain-containing protein n=1 Tax=uncultured Chloroflexi bacterium HF0500_03M05 TaxID=710737 RepID=E0XY69_9CHLR|nr:hypothetical protein [uncultured Chloroflexi bacterium HF0500_03M05]
MQQPIDILNRVVIASGDEPRSRALAGIQLLPNGELLVAYRHASTHPFGVDPIIDDGVVMTVRSTDSGRTWEEPRAVCALPGWDCGGGRSMVQTPSGELIMFIMKARRANLKTKESYIYPIKSSNNGQTWGDFGAELVLYKNGWTEPNSTGHVLVTSDGRWMIPAYGAETHDGVTYPIVSFSSDEGKTWNDRIIVCRSSPDVTFYEPAIIRLRDGRFLAIIRTMAPPYTSYQSYSENEGGIWTVPNPVTFQGQCPYLKELRSGAILCVYRDMALDHHGVSASITYDAGATWTYAGRLYDGTDWNCGYPSLVRLPNDKLLCVYYTCYEKANSEIHGVFLADRS